MIVRRDCSPRFLVVCVCVQLLANTSFMRSLLSTITEPRGRHALPCAVRFFVALLEGIEAPYELLFVPIFCALLDTCRELEPPFSGGGMQFRPL